MLGFKTFTTLSLLALLTFVPTYAIEYGGIGGRPAYPRKDEQSQTMYSSIQ